MSDSKYKRTSDEKTISHSLENDFKIFENSTEFPIPLYLLIPAGQSLPFVRKEVLKWTFTGMLIYLRREN